MPPHFPNSFLRILNSLSRKVATLFIAEYFEDSRFNRADYRSEKYTFVSSYIAYGVGCMTKINVVLPNYDLLARI